VRSGEVESEVFGEGLEGARQLANRAIGVVARAAPADHFHPALDAPKIGRHRL
jgi:hypothetical protein